MPRISGHHNHVPEGCQLAPEKRHFVDALTGTVVASQLCNETTQGVPRNTLTKDTKSTTSDGKIRVLVACFLLYALCYDAADHKFRITGHQKAGMHLVPGLSSRFCHTAKQKRVWSFVPRNRTRISFRRGAINLYGLVELRRHHGAQQSLLRTLKAQRNRELSHLTKPHLEAMPARRSSRSST